MGQAFSLRDKIGGETCDEHAEYLPDTAVSNSEVEEYGGATPTAKPTNQESPSAALQRAKAERLETLHSLYRTAIVCIMQDSL